MFEHFPGMLHFVGNQRQQLIVALSRPIRRHDNAQVARVFRCREEGQEASVQVAERAITELQVHNAV